jgi:hypothetical protein
MTWVSRSRVRQGEVDQLGASDTAVHQEADQGAVTALLEAGALADFEQLAKLAVRKDGMLRLLLPSKLSSVEALCKARR